MATTLKRPVKKASSSPPVAKTQSPAVEAARQRVAKAAPQKFDLKKYLATLKQREDEDQTLDKMNALILGLKGVGKTQLVSTAPSPVLLHSFDPGGTKTIRPEINKGMVLPDRRFEVLDKDNPRNFSLWEQEFLMLHRSNAFEQFGTYSIDSFTMWLWAMRMKIAHNKGRQDGVLEIQDWQVLGNVLSNYVRMFMALPCHVILNGHIVRERDDVSGTFITKLDAPPSLQNAIPILFDEMYVMVAEGVGTKARRVLYTAGDGVYTASTRLGRDRFEMKEKPNITYLIEKADLTV